MQAAQVVVALAVQVRYRVLELQAHRIQVVAVAVEGAETQDLEMAAEAVLALLSFAI